MFRRYLSFSSRRTRPTLRRPLTLDCLEERTTPAALLPTSFGGIFGPVQADSGDFDNDGDIDVVVVTTNVVGGGVKLAIFESDGTGNFINTIGTSLSRVPTDVVAGNFGGDGNLDVVIAYGDSTFEMRPGAGNLSFGAAVTNTPSASSGESDGRRFGEKCRLKWDGRTDRARIRCPESFASCGP